MRRIIFAVAALCLGVGLTLASASAATARKHKTRTFHVRLVGEAEHPAADPVATGTATVRMRSGQSKVCYQITTRNLPRAIAAHIHKGKAGTSGNVVIPLKTPNAAGKSSGCAKASKSLVRTIVAHPASYYVNVHTNEFPAGAIRGQLKGSSKTPFGRIIARPMKGSTEPNATGSFVLRIRRSAGLICFRLHVANITLPALAAHIHRGTAGTNGPVVVPLTAPAANGTSDGCVTVAQPLITEILGNLSGFYVNVHTREHPGGAIRGQLG